MHTPLSMWRGSQVVAHQHRTPPHFCALSAVQRNGSRGIQQQCLKIPPLYSHAAGHLASGKIKQEVYKLAGLVQACAATPASCRSTSWSASRGSLCRYACARGLCPCSLCPCALQCGRVVQYGRRRWSGGPGALMCTLYSTRSYHRGSSCSRVATRRMHVRAGAAARDGPDAGHPRAGDQRGQPRHELLVR